jgi:hypothetical protein
MNAALADALQDCLERLEAGEPMHAALARHAALSAELRPLVFAALLVRQHRPVPTPGFRARVQVALANVDLTATPEATPSQRVPAPGRAAWRPFAARLSGALLAVVLLTGGVVVASANSRPGDMLYPVRRGVEQVQEAAVHALIPVVTGVHAPRGSLGADPTSVPARSADAPRVSGAGSSSRGDAAADRSDQADDADDAVQPESRGPDRNRERPQRRASSDVEAPAAVAGAAGAAQTAPTAAPPMPTVSPEAVAMGPEVTPTPADAERQPSRPDPVQQPPDTRATPAAQAPAPTVEAAGVRLIPLPEMPRSGDSRRGGVAGVVVRDDGTPLHRATVYLYPLTSSGEPVWHWGRDTRTDDEGRYEFDGLYPGRYKARAKYGFSRSAVYRWYPAAPDPDQAEVITVTAGFVRDRTDFRFDRLPLLEIGPIPWPWLAPQPAP